MIRLDSLLDKTRAPWASLVASELGEILQTTGVDPPEITAITQDSRTVSTGALFCALKGRAVDGHDHVDAAVDQGAAAVVVEHHVTDRVPEIIVDNSRTATGELAAAFNDHPDVELVAVTGTNGKTSVVSLVAHVLNACGRPAVSMGTLTGSLTTAAAPDFHAALRLHADDGIEVVAAEVSSHALDQGRIAGSAPAVSVFTNLSQDHLDYHSDMEDYFDAKAQLFSTSFPAPAIIDVSDEWGAVLAERLTEAGDRSITAIDGASYIDGATLGQTSSQFEWRGHNINLPLGGAFSVTNAVLAAEVAVTLGSSVDLVASALATAPQIPGRFESVVCGQPFAVVVDYSHTPASVEAAVVSARALTNNRVILVFGAAGDRDPGKRPLMGASATAADVLYVTSDNPRTEDPDRIIDAVVAGVEAARAEDPQHRLIVHRVADRAEAIRSALSGALPGDIVVIAGKGHEDYQIIGTTTIDFDDRVQARAALAQLGWESAS